MAAQVVQAPAVNGGAAGGGQQFVATSLYVGDLEVNVTDAQLFEMFNQLGQVVSVRVCRDLSTRRSLGYGYVNYMNPQDAARAIEVLNFTPLNGKSIRIMYSHRDPSVRKSGSGNIFIKNLDKAIDQKKNEREQELKQKFEQSMKEAVDKSQGLNLYVKNLDDTVTDESLREYFAPFGTITSCKVMRDPNGTSKGSGFVAFSTSDEASRALMEMNGKMIAGKPLYVALAQRKEDRRARLQAQFSQMRPIAMAPAGAPRMPMFPPGGPGMGQQMFYGQAQPTFIPPQPGFGYQQQLVPGMRPGGGPLPNFFMPMVPPGQQGQRPGGRRGGVPGQQNQQQPVPLMQQQMMPRGRVYRYPPGRDVSMGSVPYDISNPMQLRDTAGISQPIPIGALASALANASPTEQRTMLGENLYPLVEQLEAESAAKVTGMLLEMDQTEVLHLLESPEALKAKVAEAMEVLRNVAQQQQQPADQLAALSLNDLN
ncbi:putative polyadenylate-binding protein/Hyperplastic disc protein [Helianthus annuus]|nr:putative polyadenylate-binding protein/Hyperplastic disc protein [Helianthus annuus]